MSANRMDKKALFISIDGLSKPFYSKLLSANKLPALAALRQKSSSGNFEGPLQALMYPVWASFLMGVAPEKHGIYAFQGLGWDKLKYPTLPDLISQAGGKVISVFTPLLSPAKALSGYVVSEQISKEQGNAFWPKQLKQELEQKLGTINFPKAEQFFPKEGLKTESDIKKFLEQQKESVTQTEKIASYLMTRYEWNLTMVHFYAADTVQHALWNYIDPQHPQYSSNQNVQKGIEEFFQVLDGSIKTLVDLAKTAAVMIFVDHGFRHCGKIINLKKALAESGVTSYEQNLAAKISRFLGFKKTESRVEIDMRVIYAPHKRAADIAERLKSLKDPETGKPVMEKIEIAAENGRAALLLKPAKGYSTRNGSEEQPLFISCRPGTDYLSGTHTAEGFWMFFAESVPAIMELPSSVEDLAPTMLRYFDIKIPEHMEGNPLPFADRVKS